MPPVRHNKRGPKKYSCNEAIQKYKDIYEKNIKQLKEDHDNYVKTLYIGNKNIESTETDETGESGKTSEIKKQYITPQEEKTQQLIKQELDKLDKLKKNSEYTVMALMEAEKLWLAIKVAITSGDSFMTMTDEQKIDVIHKDFTEFHNNFPIVTKYMVCMGHYKQSAFRKFLKLCEQKLSNAPSERNKGYMEEQWVACQANYVRYLWEDMQVKRFSRNDSNKVYQQAYTTLSNDFKKFKELHKHAEDQIKKDEKKHKVELLKEVARRMINGEQNPEIEKTRALVNKLRDKKYKQNYEHVIHQIQEVITFVKPLLVASGTNEEARKEYEDELKQANYKKNYQPMNLSPQVI